MKEMELVKVMEMVANLDCENCEGCPFAKMCAQHELFWGCPVWEDAMGEDL